MKGGLKDIEFQSNLTDSTERAKILQGCLLMATFIGSDVVLGNVKS